MAKVFRCDRCNEFEKEVKNQFGGKRGVHPSRFEGKVCLYKNKENEEDYRDEVGDYELCGTCFDTVQKFIKTPPPKKDE